MPKIPNLLARGFFFESGINDSCNRRPDYLTERLILPLFDPVLQWIGAKSRKLTLQNSGVAASNEKEGAMATQQNYREQTPRQTGRTNLRWGAAKFLTSSQVARTLQVSETRVLGWLEKVDLGGLKTGRHWYVSPRQLERFLEARANVP